VTESYFRLRFGLKLIDIYPKQIDELIHIGLLEYAQTSEFLNSEVCVRLTKRGRLLGNQVFMRFLID